MKEENTQFQTLAELLRQFEALKAENQTLKQQLSQKQKTELPQEIYDSVENVYSWVQNPANMAKHLNLIYRETVTNTVSLSEGDPLKKALTFFGFLITGIEKAIHS